ncbi:A disintegrin and metalloproteinase with thrombospondin motifs 3-like [Anneissia japonica]|uniref:A disintegrin and metalloproteinase with thrombospondin motifs 3-like n=1 Tax=Anneissia japonica TaxID=1529436 RepID=UPI0014254FC1|nr:A disintegrin and metalloproteinase with thrombospondin motifs 3-like [Anneissia japonica]
MLMNIAADAFRDSSFKFNVNLVISKIIYLDQHNSSLMIDKSSVSRTRKNVGHYMFPFNTMDDTNPDHFDACIYITRNFFGPEGYAKTSGICSMLESTVIVRDGGYRNAYVIAHEIGHLLSIKHDDFEWNSCQKDVSQKSVMSPQVASTYSQHPWSECSNDYFEEFVKTPKAKCLHDEPFHDKVLHLPGESHPGFGVSSDDQCKAAYDSKYATCARFATGNMLCKTLWCSKMDNPYFCLHKNVPPLEGTVCRENKWCIRGKCVDSTKKQPKKNGVDGGWTDWSKLTECSVSCGVGISSRSRKCTNPEPKNGGKYCEGDNIEYTTCNVQLCDGVKTDLRAELCREKNQVLIPAVAENESEQCLLKCVPNKPPMSGEVVVSGPVPDGTFCSYDSPSSICINGECTKLGCDNVIGSQAKVDSCGVCQGTNETCSTTKIAFKKKMKKNAYVITTIPVGARHVRVVEKARTGHFLVLRNVDKGENIFDTRSSVWPTSDRSVISAGVKLTFSINEDGLKEITSSPGPILNKLNVKIYRNETDSTVPSFKCRFITEREEEGLTIFASARSARVEVVRNTPQSQYDWVMDSVTKCTATCDGGFQKEIYKCKRASDMKVVNKRKCKTKAPNTRIACAEQACKTYSWDISAWSDCSKTCGGGKRTRSVKCIRSVNGKTKTMKPTHCTGTSPRPNTTETCSVRSC